jgi:hypothetical protein
LSAVSREFLIGISILNATQALLVLAPGAGIPAWLHRFKTKLWALIAPVSIAVVVAAIAFVPEVADGLTWFALLLVPPGALLALGWAMRGAKPIYALVAAAALVVALVDVDSPASEGAAAFLTALSCITLGRLLAGLVPAAPLKLGIIAMAVIDAILVFGNQLQGPAATLNAAVPAPGLPQLQYLDVTWARMGYGDVFVAGLLGGILAVERRRQAPAALLVLILCWAWDMLFFHFNTLPATVPVAVAIVILELWYRRAPSARPLASER